MCWPLWKSPEWHPPPSTPGDNTFIEVLNVTSTGTEISHIQSECTKSGLKVTLLMLRVAMTLGTD